MGLKIYGSLMKGRLLDHHKPAECVNNDSTVEGIPTKQQLEYLNTFEDSTVHRPITSDSIR